MIVISAGIDCRFGMREGKPLVEYTFDGDDDGHPCTGRAWGVIDDDGEIRGRMYIHLGDDSGFVTERARARVRRQAGRHARQPPSRSAQDRGGSQTSRSLPCALVDRTVRVSELLRVRVRNAIALWRGAAVTFTQSIREQDSGVLLICERGSRTNSSEAVGYTGRLQRIWLSPYARRKIAHELGHVMGLQSSGRDS